MKIRLLAVLATIATNSAFSQDLVFRDQFDLAPLGWGAPPEWSTTGGTVRVVGTGYFDLHPGNGHYVSLACFPIEPCSLNKTFDSVAGHFYTVSFKLGGSRTYEGGDIVDVFFGTTQGMYFLPTAAAFQTFSLTYEATTAGPITLSFQSRPDNGDGANLDSIEITSLPFPVPEPAPALLLLGGLCALSLGRTRKAARLLAK